MSNCKICKEEFMNKNGHKGYCPSCKEKYPQWVNKTRKNCFHCLNFKTIPKSVSQEPPNQYAHCIYNKLTYKDGEEKTYKIPDDPMHILYMLKQARTCSTFIKMD